MGAPPHVRVDRVWVPDASSRRKVENGIGCIGKELPEPLGIHWSCGRGGRTTTWALRSQTSASCASSKRLSTTLARKTLPSVALGRASGGSGGIGGGRRRVCPTLWLAEGPGQRCRRAVGSRVCSIPRPRPGAGMRARCASRLCNIGRHRISSGLELLSAWCSPSLKDCGGCVNDRCQWSHHVLMH